MSRIILMAAVALAVTGLVSSTAHATQYGYRVDFVKPNSPADNAGVPVGCVIAKVAGKKFYGRDDWGLTAALRSAGSGKVSVTVYDNDDFNSTTTYYVRPLNGKIGIDGEWVKISTGTEHYYSKKKKN